MISIVSIPHTGQIEDLVNSEFKAELPDLLPKMDVTQQLPPAVVESVVEGEGM